MASESPNPDEDFEIMRLNFSQHEKKDEDSKQDQQLNYQQIINEKIKQRIDKGREFEQGNSIEKAIGEYRRAIFLDPNNAEIHVKLSSLYESIGDIQQSLAHLRKSQSLQYNSHNNEKLYNLMLQKGISMLETNKFDEYLKMLSPRNKPPPHQDGGTIEGNIAKKEDQFEVRDNGYESLRENFEEGTDAQDHFIRALAYLSENKKNKAIEELQKASDANMSNVAALILKAKLLWSMNRNHQGFLEFWKAYEIDPTHPEMIEFKKLVHDKTQEYHNIVNKNIVENDLEKAMHFLKKGLEVYPKNIKFYLLRAYIHRKQRDYEAAMKDIEHASIYLKSNPQMEKELTESLSITYNDMGIKLMEEGSYRDALEIFDEALKFKKNDWGILTNKGDCFFKIKDYHSAMDQYRKAIEASGGDVNVKVRFGLCHFYLSIKLFNLQKYYDCIKGLDEAIKWDKYNADYYSYKGKCYSKLGNSEESFLNFKLALKLNPQHKEARHFLQNVFSSTK